jgi:hypothetical protein
MRGASVLQFYALESPGGPEIVRTMFLVCFFTPPKLSKCVITAIKMSALAIAFP